MPRCLARSEAPIAQVSGILMAQKGGQKPVCRCRDTRRTPGGPPPLPALPGGRQSRASASPSVALKLSPAVGHRRWKLPAIPGRDPFPASRAGQRRWTSSRLRAEIVSATTATVAGFRIERRVSDPKKCKFEPTKRSCSAAPGTTVVGGWLREPRRLQSRVTWRIDMALLMGAHSPAEAPCPDARQAALDSSRRQRST